MNETDQNWRQFQGTELGGLLSSIYGGVNRRKINYPQPKRKEFDPTASKFRPVNSTLQSSDPTKSTRRAVSVSVPKHFGRSDSQENVSFAINGIPSRRSEEAIRAELEEINMRQRNYRPAYVAPRGDHEKERFAQICAYKGGKGLPVVMPVGETPMEYAAKQSMKQKNEAFIQQRRLMRGDKRASAEHAVHRSPRISDEEKLAEQIKTEIEERTSYLEEMRALGGMSKREEQQLRNEINARIQEIQGLGL